MSITEFSTRLAIAILAGFLIGFERKWHQKNAGIRTHALVAAGAAIYVLISVNLTENGQGDATRIVGQVVVGIGFLGAGLIMQDGLNVQGLNSAATVWCSAALGCLAGAGWFAEVAVSTLAILIINLFFRIIENQLDKKHDRKNAHLKGQMPDLSKRKSG